MAAFSLTPAANMVTSRNDVGNSAKVHAATLELPLEGPLLTGGLAFVLHVPPGGWHARERSGRSDFHVSTREASPVVRVEAHGGELRG